MLMRYHQPVLTLNIIMKNKQYKVHFLTPQQRLGILIPVLQIFTIQSAH